VPEAGETKLLVWHGSVEVKNEVNFALYESSPLQRRLRDSHAAAQQAAVQQQIMSRSALSY
jgi:hypothetical protein